MVTGFLNILVASRNVNVKRFVYAASSSTYGDHPILPKVEERIGKPLSPYAITKYINELYAEIFSSTYALQSIGLRYFNVFGPRQDSKGAYAAVIPKWVESMMEDEEVYINGNGETTRDFCYIENVVQANLIAARTLDLSAVNQIYNVAYGEETSLNEVYIQIKKNLIHTFPNLANAKPEYRDFRKGDVLQSLACIKKAREKLGYEPSYDLRKGLELTVDWYLKNRLN